MKKTRGIITILLLLLSTTIVLAEYSIDIAGLENEEYQIGEKLEFNVLLLDGEELVEEEIQIRINDILNKKEITKTLTSNNPTSIMIGEDFPSGLWSITATTGEATVERSFSIGENAEVEFLIEEDNLIIRNLGNVRYTKTIKITIGGESSSYTQNIPIGAEKTLKLVSPEGTYQIEVTDGTKTLRRENVQLFGTGNVIGAVDKELVGYSGLGGGADPNEDAAFISLDRLPTALTFVVGVMVLGALVFTERKVAKKKKK